MSEIIIDVYAGNISPGQIMIYSGTGGASQTYTTNKIMYCTGVNYYFDGTGWRVEYKTSIGSADNKETIEKCNEDDAGFDLL